MIKQLMTGNLTANARVNTVSEKLDAVSFTVACNDGYKGQDGNWVDQVEFIDCTRFVETGKGERLAELLVKGREVEVEGSLQSAKPRAGTDGKTYHNKFIRVEEVKLGRMPSEKTDKAQA